MRRIAGAFGRLGAWIGVLVAAGALAGCEGRRRTASVRAESHEAPRVGPAVAVLDLSDGVPERPPAGFLGLPGRGASFGDLVEEIDRLERESKARGVLVRLGAARIGIARAL